MGFRKEVDRQTATDTSDRTSRAAATSRNCNCKPSGEKMAILGDTRTVSSDGDWIHSDCSDEDEAEWQPELGVRGVGPARTRTRTRNGEFPPRVRWLRRKQLHRLITQRMAVTKCAHWHHDDHGAGKVTARPQIQLEDSPPHSRKRKRDDAETTVKAVARSESHDRISTDNDGLGGESTRKLQRFGSCSVERLGASGLPANTDGPCEVAAPPIMITEHLSEASTLSMGPRRSQRIREKLGSA